jgi:hypothetical protein
MATAWVEDAQVLTDLEDLANNHNSVLLRTAEVSEFLTDENSPSCALVAPKGFGKTFILKLKRSSLQGNGWKCFPNGLIVDRPKDSPPILVTDNLSLLEASEAWSSLWQIALITCYLKGLSEDQSAKSHLERLTVICRSNSTVHALITNPNIDTPLDILHACLDIQRSSLHEVIRLASNFTGAFKNLHKKAAIFVDNVDEYLQDYINLDYLRQITSTKTTKHDEIYLRYLRIWHNGQIGAWVALRRLHGINPHVKIYISIRKEAYHYAAQHQAEFQNLRSFHRELRYKKSDIQQIIENNITVEAPEKLADRYARRPLVRFLGEGNQFISNSGTGKQETVLEYWLRHCSLRPRDAVAIGKKLSNLNVADRTPNAIRTEINASAAERAQSLFTEVSPFFDALYPDVIPRILDSNVLNWQEINAAASAYSRLVKKENGVKSVQAVHPFCALYSIGLIGVVQPSRDNPEQLIQSFSPVGEVPFGSINVLPKAELYVVHPALSDYIAKKNVKFLTRLNRHNVVGDGLEWRPVEDRRFVVVADMRGYRQSVMNNVGAAQTFQRFWDDLFKQYTLDLDYAQPSGGDSLVLGDRSVTRLLRAAKGLSSGLLHSSYKLELRVGGHSGFWRINSDTNGAPKPEIADILGTAARVEPLAKPGHFVFTEEFLVDAHRQSFDADARTRMVTDEYIDQREWDKEKGVNLAKSHEPPEWRKLFFLTLTN